MMATMLVTALSVALFAITNTTRDAPWHLTGISKDQRSLEVVYEGSGCLLDDGRPVVETTDTEVRITVKQTQQTGEYLACAEFLAFYPLTVPLDGPLYGRFITGGPDFPAQSSPDTVPRVIGLRRTDATRALRRQGFRTRFDGRPNGVVRYQQPPAGKTFEPDAVPRVTLYAGPFDPAAALSISIAPGQTIQSLLRRGLRFRFTANPEVEIAISANLICSGFDAGEYSRPIRRRHPQRHRPPLQRQPHPQAPPRLLDHLPPHRPLVPEALPQPDRLAPPAQRLHHPQPRRLARNPVLTSSIATRGGAVR